jgi:cytochrome o ubiquinol oxidase subunit 2
MTRNTRKTSQSRPGILVIIGLICLGLIIMMLLRGTKIALFDPKGLIASKQLKLMIISIIILSEIAIPALFIFYYTAWKYRETNEKAIYNSSTHPHKSLVFSIWAFPTVTMLLLAVLMWPAAHNLAAQKPIVSNVKPLYIQVIAMRWKWLFIYPEQNVATVNFIQIPTNTPVQFDLTADEAPMSSFWIPQLGGQLYAMTGHVNRLNLIANNPGDYSGRSAEINGAGFAGMEFTTRASTSSDFDQWVQKVKTSPNVLDDNTYNKLLTPSEYNIAAYFSKTAPDLYGNMLIKYAGTHNHNTRQE